MYLALILYVLALGKHRDCGVTGVLRSKQLKRYVMILKHGQIIVHGMKLVIVIVVTNMVTHPAEASKPFLRMYGLILRGRSSGKMILLGSEVKQKEPEK